MIRLSVISFGANGRKNMATKRPGVPSEATSRKRRKLGENLHFCTLKCKLATAVRSREVLSRLKEEVLLAHELFKRTMFFMRLFFLKRGRVPPLSLSLVKECINRVSTRNGSGAKPKDTGLGEELDDFWKQSFGKIYPNLLDFRGRSQVKQLLAEQMLSNILVDVKTHFKSRLRTFLEFRLTGSGCEVDCKKKEARRLTGLLFARSWSDVPSWLRRDLEGIIPPDVEKSVAYDVKKKPERYLSGTLNMCLEMEGAEDSKCKAKVHFFPTRISSIPCHCKFDTETVASFFVP